MLLRDFELFIRLLLVLIRDRLHHRMGHLNHLSLLDHLDPLRTPLLQLTHGHHHPNRQRLRSYFLLLLVDHHHRYYAKHHHFLDPQKDQLELLNHQLHLLKHELINYYLLSQVLSLVQSNHRFQSSIE